MTTSPQPAKPDWRDDGCRRIRPGHRHAAACDLAGNDRLLNRAEPARPSRGSGGEEWQMGELIPTMTATWSCAGCWNDRTSRTTGGAGGARGARPRRQRAAARRGCWGSSVTLPWRRTYMAAGGRSAGTRRVRQMDALRGDPEVLRRRVGPGWRRSQRGGGGAGSVRGGGHLFRRGSRCWSWRGAGAPLRAVVQFPWAVDDGARRGRRGAARGAGLHGAKDPLVPLARCRRVSRPRWMRPGRIGS
jgi:hypothetical protein